MTGWASFTRFKYASRTFLPTDVLGDGNCLFHCASLHEQASGRSATLLRSDVHQYALGAGHDLACAAMAMYDGTSNTSGLDHAKTTAQRIAAISRSGNFAGNTEVLLLAVMLNINVVVYSSTAPAITVFCTDEVLERHLYQHVPVSSTYHDDNNTLFVYHHAYLDPLYAATWAHASNLNHFAHLGIVRVASGAATSEPEPLALPDVPCLPPPAKKRLIQASLATWCEKPVSKGAKRKGLFPSANTTTTTKATGTTTPRPMTATKLALHAKNMAVLGAWRSKHSIDMTVKATYVSMGLDRVKACDAIVAARDSVVGDTAAPIVSRGHPHVPRGRPPCVTSYRKELSWPMRFKLIAFYLHSHLGNQKLVVFNAVLGHLAIPETMRGWLRARTIPIWFTPVSSLTMGEITSVIPSEHVGMFSVATHKDTKVATTVMNKYKARIQSSAQLQLVYNTGVLCAQKLAAAAATAHVKLVTLGTQRIQGRSRRGKHTIQEKYATSKVIGRFEQGDPMTLIEAVSAIQIKFQDGTYPNHKSFLTFLNNEALLRQWLHRLLDRIGYSSRIGTISQKVPVAWFTLATSRSASIRKAALDLNVDDVCNMDKTYVLFHYSDRVLVPIGTRRVGTLVPVANEKRGVTLAVTASLRSSCLLAPFIIDTGEFGADLMQQWGSYTKSTVVFNKTHWMTSYTFILYLDWVVTVNVVKRLMLVVDKATTHYGCLVDKWIAENRAAPSRTQVFVHYIDEGMTSIHQVCDIAVNKPLKAAIKKAYFKARAVAVAGLKTADLVGMVYSVPREDLVGMIEDAYETINEGNTRRRWITSAFDQCGQNPWAADQSGFEKHLASLNENTVYQNMTEANKRLDLLQ